VRDLPCKNRYLQVKSVRHSLRHLRSSTLMNRSAIVSSPFSQSNEPRPPEALGVRRRLPLWLGMSLLPLLSLSLVWSAFADFLSWRHTQLLAGAIGGLALLFLRLIPTNARGTSAGKTPMAVIMFAMISSAMLGLMSGHPQLWHGAMIILMLSGVTAWLWYPPEAFAPFRAAAQASIALSFALLCSFYLELLGWSPWHAALAPHASHDVLRGALDHSQTLSTALFLSSIALIVAAWPNPNVSRITQRLAQITLVLTCITALCWVSPINFPARIAIAVAVAIGIFWRPHLKHTRNHHDRRYRWGAIFAVFGILVVFTLPPLLSQRSPYANAQPASASAPSTLSTSWRVIDPVPTTIDRNLRQAEWSAALRNLPFGAGAGTSADETIRHLKPDPETHTYEASAAPFGWANTPRSAIATLIIEHGIITVFVWILLTAGGLLLARLVIIHSNFPPAIAQVIGVTPGVAIAFLPGASQMAPALAMVLAWFLLCAPLAQAEARMAARLVPAPSTPSDQRRAPRGRIILLLIPGVFIAWFSIANARWSRSAYRGYTALSHHEHAHALGAFHRANRIRNSATILTQEALLLEQLEPQAATAIEELYHKALRLQPRSALIHVARAQWFIRTHAAPQASSPGIVTTPHTPSLTRALDDLEIAQRNAPHWEAIAPLKLETLILLDRLDDADAYYAGAMASAQTADEKDALRLLRIRQLAWKRKDLHAAKRLWEEAHNAALHPDAQSMLQSEKELLETWERSGVNPYTEAHFHLGHIH